MLGVELALFIIVGAIAILAAVMMLVSENAVHAALFLILNFACVAFFYLMLNAPFLAMVQITVYAGAIMVLFLFVIMLLGAEKLTPESSPRFSWLTPAAVGLTTLFLLVSGIAIMQSDIDASEPEPDEPLVRIIHAVGEAPPVDVYVDGELVAEDLAFSKATDYQTFEVGSYEIVVYPHNADPDTTEPILTTPLAVNNNDVATIIVMNDDEDGVAVTRVDGSLEALEDDDEAQLTVVHAFGCGLESCVVDIADITNPDDNPILLIEDLDYGEVSPVKLVEEDERTLAAFPAGEVAAYLALAEDDDEAEFDVEPLAEINEREIESNHSLLWVISGETIDEERVRPANIFVSVENDMLFGSGEALGRRLFTTYMLPFQAIALLLLTAMVGVIVMTNAMDTTHPKRRHQRTRRLANVPGNPTVEEYRRNLENGTGD